MVNSGTSLTRNPRTLGQIVHVVNQSNAPFALASTFNTCVARHEGLGVHQLTTGITEDAVKEVLLALFFLTHITLQQFEHPFRHGVLY